MRRVYTAALATLALLGAVEAQANYTKTKYPIVLVHGVTGFNTIGGLVNYFHTIPWNLERDGARVHVASVAAFNDTVQRLLDEQRRERDWQQHYQAYRNELASLQGRGLSEADGEQLQRQLRERLFSSEDRHRVETYDAIAAKQPEPLDP